MDKIRKGDEIVVTTGKDKGKRGTVSIRVDAEHVVVDGINQAKKHVKPNPVKGVVGVLLIKTCRCIYRMCRSITPLQRKRTVSASSSLKMVRKYVSLSLTANWLGHKERSWRVC